MIDIIYDIFSDLLYTLDMKKSQNPDYNFRTKYLIPGIQRDCPHVQELVQKQLCQVYIME